MSDNIIFRLRDDEEYYSGIGRKYLSNSDIGTLLSNPKDYGRSRKDSNVFAMGRYFHQLFLEPEKAKGVNYIDVASRNTKIYKEHLHDVQKDIVLLKKEVVEVERWVDAMNVNMEFFELINGSDNVYEQPAVGKLFGRDWKGKSDILAPDAIYDLKTTSNINDFRWNFRKYNYDSQAYIYSTLFNRPMVFLVIDKNTLMMGKYTVSDESLERGENKVKRAVSIYNKFFGDNPTEDIGQFYFSDEV